MTDEEREYAQACFNAVEVEFRLGCYLDVTSGMSPSEHASFWEKMWKVQKLKQEHPRLYARLTGELTEEWQRTIFRPLLASVWKGIE